MKMTECSVKVGQEHETESSHEFGFSGLAKLKNIPLHKLVGNNSSNLGRCLLIFEQAMDGSLRRNPTGDLPAQTEELVKDAYADYLELRHSEDPKIIEEIDTLFNRPMNGNGYTVRHYLEGLCDYRGSAKC